MGIAPSVPSEGENDQLVDAMLDDDAYAAVKIVADNIEDVKTVADGLNGIEENLELIQQGVDAATAAAASAVAAAASEAAAEAAAAIVAGTEISPAVIEYFGDVSEPLVIVIAGQSNAAGANNGGPNPTNARVKTWDAVTGDFVAGGQYNALPWTRANPDGNTGNNNIGLAAAHRLAEITGREVHVIFDAVGGTHIEDWVSAGTASTRYAALKVKVEAALLELGRTSIDMLVWAQGEEDASEGDSFSTHVTALTTLDNQLRAESWVAETTPIYMTGSSDLHDRYQVQHAIRYYCSKINSNCIYVNSNRPRATVFAQTGAGDATHFVGDALWELGYNKISMMFLAGYTQPESESVMMFGRGVGPANFGDATVIFGASSIVNWDSRDLTAAPGVNSIAATGSITWGYQCGADGNYTQTFGYMNTTDNLCNYTMITGRENSADASGDYSLVSGFQNIAQGTYQVIGGRGNTPGNVSAAVALGTFSKFTDGTRLFQYGIGTTAVNRANAFAITNVGSVEFKAPSTALDPPGREMMVFKRLSDTSLQLSMMGMDDTIRGVAIPLDATVFNIAVCDGTGKIPMSLLPPGLVGGISYQGTWNATTNTPAIPAADGDNVGHYYKVATAGTTSVDGINEWAVGDWIISNGVTWDKIDNTDKIVSVNGYSGVVVLVKGDIGLGNVDNTSDVNKPVSTAQQTALDLKADALVSVGTINASVAAANNWNNTHKVASGGATPTLTLGNISTGVSFSVRFSTAWQFAVAGGLSKNGAAPGGVTTGNVAANKLVTFIHEGAGVWLASGDIT